MILPCTNRRVRSKFTVDESQIKKLVDFSTIFRGASEFEHLLTHQQSLILLPEFLSRVSNDFGSGNTLNSLLRIVHKYPLSEYHHSHPDGVSSLYEQVIAAAKKYLGPYSPVSVRFYTQIPLIQIPNSRYAA